MYKFDYDWFSRRLLQDNIMEPIRVSEIHVEYAEVNMRGLAFEVRSGIGDRYIQFAELYEDGQLDEYFDSTSISKLVEEDETLLDENGEVNESLVTYMKLVELILQDFRRDVLDEMDNVNNVLNAIDYALGGKY